MSKLEEAADNEIGLSIKSNKEPNNDLISISTRILNKGESLFVKSLVNDSPLSELKMYNMSGNEILHKPITGTEYTLNASVVSGLYVLSIKLKNKLSKEFKILVI